jgi:cytochrome P450
VEKALGDWKTFSNSRSDILELVKSKFDMPPGVLMFQDPPTHTMLRGLMGRVFTPRRMAAIEDQIRQYCVRCLDPHVGSDGFDIIAELASMMPMRVIGMLLGIPEEDQIEVRDANDANLRTRPGAPMKVIDPDAIADGRIYADYVDWRAKTPSDDLMTALLNEEFEDEKQRDPQTGAQRGAALHPGRRRSRQRDDRPTHRLAGQSPCRTSRSAT